MYTTYWQTFDRFTQYETNTFNLLARIKKVIIIITKMTKPNLTFDYLWKETPINFNIVSDTYCTTHDNLLGLNITIIGIPLRAHEVIHAQCHSHFLEQN